MPSSAFSPRTQKYEKKCVKKKSSQKSFDFKLLFSADGGGRTHTVLLPIDFEFLSSSSIWCHPVISSDIWFPLHKGEIHVSMNNNLKYPRFFDAFSLYSVFSIWIAQMEIGGMFRRDAGPVIQDCAHRLFSFFGKYFKPVQFRGRLIRIQNEATKPGAHPSSDTQ